MDSQNYLATNIFDTDGVRTSWQFSFAGASPESNTTPYLAASDVKATELFIDINGNQAVAERAVLIDPQTPNVARIVGPAIVAGRRVKIYRQTEIRFPLVDYRDRQSVSESDLDLANRQAIFVAQETRDAASDNLLQDRHGNYDAKGRRVVNLAPGINPSDAVNVSQLNRTIRVPEDDSLAPLPDRIARAGRAIAFDQQGNLITSLPATGSGTELAMDLLNATDTTKMAALVRFLQAGLGAEARTLLDKCREIKTPQDFGAKADGTSDDWSAIQEAMDTGGHIYFPPGIYRVSKTLTVRRSDTHMYAGAEGYIGTQIHTLPGFVGNYGFQVNNFGFVFKSLMFRGDGKLRGVGATIHGFNFDRADGAADIDSFVQNSAITYVDTAVRAIGKNLMIRDNLIGQAKRGIAWNQRPGTSCYGMRFIGNRFHGVGGADYVGSGDNDPNVSGENPGYCFDGRNTGDVSFTEITGNYADTSGYFFIGRLPFGTLSNNIIKDAWSSGIVLDNSTHVTVVGNQLRSGFGSKDTGYGMHFKSVSMSTIVGNIASGYGRHGFFHETGFQCSYVGNHAIDNNWRSVDAHDGFHFAVGTNTMSVTSNISRTTTGGTTRQRRGIYNGGESNYFHGNLCQANVVADFVDEATITYGTPQSIQATRRIVWLSAIPTTGKWQRGDLVHNTIPVQGGPLGWVCVGGGAPGNWVVSGIIPPAVP